MGRKLTEETKAKIRATMRAKLTDPCPFHHNEFEGTFVCYYLPKEHYVGATGNPYQTWHRHKKREGRDVSGMKILSFHETWKEARHRENIWHSYLGCEGMHEG